MSPDDPACEHLIKLKLKNLKTLVFRDAVGASQANLDALQKAYPNCNIKRENQPQPVGDQERAVAERVIGLGGMVSVVVKGRPIVDGRRLDARQQGNRVRRNRQESRRRCERVYREIAAACS